MQFQADKILVRELNMAEPTDESAKESMINRDRLKREVYCRLCNLTTINDEPVPTCKLCGNTLITVLKSTLTGKVITGEK